ncbi:MAG: lectin like domain-containing protein [Lachnospiraceae bacterium]|nr:lectin like domain-containing protein [Lachnospiraceae bacterium]
MKRKIVVFFMAFMMLTTIPTSAFTITNEGSISDIEIPSDSESSQNGLLPSGIKIEYTEGTEETDNLPSKFIPKTASSTMAEYKAATTSVKDQGMTGACWAFATFGNLESFYLTKEKKEYDFSENHMRYAMTNGDKYTNPYGYDLNVMDGGNYWMSLAYLTRNTAGGPVYEKNDPFDENNDRPVSTTLSKPITGQYVKSVKMLGDVDYTPSTDHWWKKAEYKNYISDIKAMIQSYGAVYSGYCDEGSQTVHYNKFQYADKTKGTGIAYLSDLRNDKGNYSLVGEANHAITIVGWDDSFSRDNFYSDCKPDSNGAFLVKNSWGDSWGEGGYFWISYEEMFSETCAVTSMTTRKSLYDHLYEYDTLGLTDIYSADSKTFTIMNRFSRETTKQQKVTAVSSYFLQPGVTVNVYVSPNGDASKLTKVASKKISDPGFQVIPLDTKITITDSQYLVAVECKSSSENVDFSVEDRWTWQDCGMDLTTQAKASAGQSYFGTTISSVKKGSYTDLTKEVADGKELENANICLKAYTKNTGTTLKSISKVSVSNVKTKTYTGSNTSQSPVVKLNGKKLTKGTDYKISYSNNKKPGVATMKITGIGKYYGTVSKKYNIKPKKTSITSLSSKSKKKLTVKWKKSTGATGYKVYVRKQGSKKWTLKKTTSKTSYTISKLTSKKKYYVKVRAYKKSGSKTIYSSYSATKSKKIK